MFVIDDIAASLAVDLIIKLGKRGLKKSEQKKYEHLLKAAIYKSISEFEKNNKIDEKEGKYPFYQSQVFMNALLSLSFIKGTDQSEILRAMQDDNRLLPPTEKQINSFLEILNKYVNENQELLEIEFESKYKGEIFNISGKVDSIEEMTKVILEIIKNGKPELELPKFLTPPHLVAEEEVIGREDNIEEIEELLSNTNKVLLVNGLGGIGKTTAAKLYITLKQENYKHIAWIDGSVSLTAGLTNAVDLIENLNLNNLEKIDEKEFALQILGKLRNIDGPNLLVVDNAKENIISETENLPSKPNWQVLLTSREHLHPFKEYPLDRLLPQKAKELFKLHYKRDVVEADLDELLKLINYHTLSIELLAKTLASGAHLKGIKELINYLKNHKLDADKLQVNIRMGDDPEYIQVYSYLVNAFDISILSDEEVWMLKQISILPPDDIDAGTLLMVLNTEKPKEQEYINLLNSLYDKGWIDRNVNNSYKAHQVIQEVVKYKTRPVIEECSKLIEAVTGLLALDQTKDNPVHKFKWIKFGESLLDSFHSETDKLSPLNNNLGMIFKEKGNYKTAKGCLEKALDSAIKNFGEDHPNIAIRRSNLALVYQDLSDYENAKMLLEKALDSDVKNFGEDHPNTATRRSNLALVYKDLGDYENAKILLEKALDSDIKNFAEDHPNIALRRSNLATVYQDLGDYENAKMLLEKALDYSIKNFEEDHPNTAIRRSNLALVYKALGDYKNAKILLEKASDAAIKNFGEDHPNTAVSRSNLATVYQDLGDYENAKMLLEKALDSDIKSFGEDHPNTATSFNNLAFILYELNEKKKASQYWLSAYKTMLKAVGENHQKTLAIKSWLDSVAGKDNWQHLL